MRNSSDIDAALLAYLGSDLTLLSLCPNGVYFDEAPDKCTRFVIVSLVDGVDQPMQGGGGRAIEERLYIIEARMLSTSGSDLVNVNAAVNAAAAQLDALLEDHKLLAPGSTDQVAGYAWMYLSREGPARGIERDTVDPNVRWFRRGGHYRVMMSCE